MLCGQPPFHGSLTELVYKHAEEAPPDICSLQPAVPTDLAAILRKMLAKQPGDRYQTPTELLADLRRVGQPEQPAKVRASPKPAEAPEPAPGLQEIIRRRAQTELTQRRGTDERTSIDRDTALLPNPTPKQHRIAVGQFEKGSEAIAKGNFDYGISLLLSCCNLDPANLRYRQLLRRAEESNYERNPAVKLGTAVHDWILKARLKAAKKTHAYEKVLEFCEQILVHEPHDFCAQFEAATAAKEIGLLNSAVWMLERLRKQYPDSAQVSRQLARWYEDQEDFNKAIALWESIAKADPLNGESRQKLQELAANQTICRGGYEELLERPQHSSNEKTH
jgi:tetratricopeptide (TPR) repeat protein